MTDADPDELVQPHLRLFAVVHGHAISGFRSFGADGRVPGWEYDDAALDTGGGLRPELTGRGLGGPVLAAGLEFGRERFAPAPFRVSAAADGRLFQVLHLRC